MSWLSDIGDALGGALGVENAGSRLGDYITNDIFGSDSTNAINSSSQGSSFFSPAFLSTALESATGLAGGLYANKAQKEADERARKYEMEKLKLQAQYGLLGSGGGGGSNKDALLYKAYQDWLATRQENRKNIGAAYGDLAAGAQRALRR
jgi:hypothetical protein